MQVQKCVLLQIPAVICGLTLSGCAGILSPEPPAVFVDKHQENNRLSVTELNRLKTEYNNALWGVNPNIPLANEARDEMLWGLIADIDYSYYYFESRFASGRATIKTVGDMAQLGMSAAATALGGSAALSAATTALAGSQLSADKNFLDETATANLFVQMDALRAKQMAVIQQKMLLNSTSYSFEEAYRDALAYFAAGTIPAAESNMVQTAGAQTAQANSEIDAAIQARIVGTLPAATLQNIVDTSTLRSAIGQAMTEGDAGKAKMVAVLKALNIAPKDSVSDVALQLEDVLRSKLTPDQKAELLAQFKTAGLIK